MSKFFDDTMQGLLEAVEIEKEQNRLTSIYNITNVHAGCYMCNFENKYICVEYNGGCSGLDKCRSIYEKELSYE